MYYFWPTPGAYSVASNSLSRVISHLRNLGGDRSQWCILAKTNQGMVDVPVLDSWF